MILISTIDLRSWIRSLMNIFAIGQAASFAICFEFHSRADRATGRLSVTLLRDLAKPSTAINLKGCLFEVKLKLIIIFKGFLSESSFVDNRL